MSSLEVKYDTYLMRLKSTHRNFDLNFGIPINREICLYCSVSRGLAWPTYIIAFAISTAASTVTSVAAVFVTSIAISAPTSIGIYVAAATTANVTAMLKKIGGGVMVNACAI